VSASTLTHRYEPRGVLRKAFHARDDEVLVAGPAGTGKSRACLEKLNAMALLNPGMRGLIVRKTLTSLGSTALVTWREHVIPEALAAGVVVFYGGSASEPPQYRYSNGSTIAIGGMDKSTRIMSSEYDVVYVQEAVELTETDWEAITTRLRNHKISFQQLLADCNPDMPTHWLKVRGDSGKTRVFDSRHEDNPVLFNLDGTMTEKGEAYVGKLDNLTGVRYQRLRKGLWVAAEGIIFEEYDPAIHLADRFEADKWSEETRLCPSNIPWDWPRYWVVDFGFTNPFVCQWWAEDPDGRLYRYREIYKTRVLVEDHATRILELVTRPVEGVEQREGERLVDALHAGRREWTEPRPVRVLADHDAEDRETFRRHVGIATQPADKRVSLGLQAVMKRLRMPEDGRARLVFLRDSVVDRDDALVDAKLPASTEEEVPGYVWKTSPADVKAGRAPKEEPLKENDHGCDTTRYLIADRDLRGRNTVRFI